MFLPMHSIGRILLPAFMILLLASCTEQEPVRTAEPIPIIETISFDGSWNVLVGLLYRIGQGLLMPAGPDNPGGIKL